MSKSNLRGGFGLRLLLAAGSTSALLLAPCLLTPAVSANRQAAGLVAGTTLFSQAAERLAARPNLAADFEIVTTFATDYLDTKETGTVSLAHPNLLRIDIDRHRRIRDGHPWEPTGNGSVTVSDGKQTYNVTTHPKSSQYETQPVSEKWLASALAPLAPLSAFFSKDASAPSNASAPAQQTIDGETFEVVTASESGETRTYYFDSDGYLRRIVTDRVPGVSSGERSSFLHRDVRLSRFRALSDSEAASRFAYTPPADSVKVAGGRRATSGVAAQKVAIGDTAPEIVAEDVNGKTVKLTDFAGKPVLVKFWATWCWPCRQSLPETEELAKENDGKATVLAVALWDSRKAFRDFVNKYAADRHTTPDKLPIRFVFDPRPMGEDAGSSLYGIRATPTHVVIGRDGKIAAISSGYNGPSKTLATAIAAAR